MPAAWFDGWGIRNLSGVGWAGVSLSPTGLELRQILSRGKQNPEVRILQRRLAELGYLETEPTGFFDDETAEAVRRLQKAHAIQVDGAAGPATKMVLYHLVGRSLAEVRQE